MLTNLFGRKEEGAVQSHVKNVDFHTLHAGYITFGTSSSNEYLMVKEEGFVFISSKGLERKKVIFFGAFSRKPGGAPDVVKVGVIEQHKPFLFITDDGVLGKTTNVVRIHHVQQEERGVAPLRSELVR